MVAGEPACAAELAPGVAGEGDAVPACGHEVGLQRSIARQAVWCEMAAWQLYALGDGDENELTANGCALNLEDRASDGDKRKGMSVALDDLPEHVRELVEGSLGRKRRRRQAG
jgi:hypothetical protein